jgi:hypothetical protein
MFQNFEKSLWRLHNLVRFLFKHKRTDTTVVFGIGTFELDFSFHSAINFKSSKKIRTRHDETTCCVCDCGILHRKSITCSVKLTTKRSKPNKRWLGRWVRGLYLGNFSCDVSGHHDKAHCFVLFSWLCSPSHCLLKILQQGTSSNRKPILSRKHTNQRRDFCPSNQNEIPSTKAASAVIVSSYSWTKEMWKTRPKTSEVDKKGRAFTRKWSYYKAAVLHEGENFAR